VKSRADAGLEIDELRPQPASISRERLKLDTTVAPVVVTILAVVLIVRDQGGYFPTSFGWSALGLLAVSGMWVAAGARTDARRLDAAFLIALIAAAGWVGLSVVWSVDPAQSVLELERWLVLVSACAAFLLLARRDSLVPLTAALVVAITSICAYSLSTRLLPTHGNFSPGDPTAGYRLFDPVGYWNGLGIFAVMGILLALGLVTDPSAGILFRSLGAVALTLLPVTLYFTFSRGAWLALGAGALLSIVASANRPRLVIEGALFALAPAIAIVIASRSHALTDENAVLAAAARQGHRAALVLVVLAAVSAGLVPLVARVERRAAVGRRGRLVFELALLFVAIVAAAGLLLAEGGPVAIAKRGYDSFSTATPPRAQTDLNGRLFDLNGNGRGQLWSVAFASLNGHWLAGTGAGSFERNWNRSPRANEVVHDAHGLYVETLSELGIVGLGLLLVVLALPVVAVVRARKVPLVPAILGAYGAFLLHNGVDWDWELSGVAVTGLLIGCLALVAARGPREARLGRPARTIGGLAIAVAASFALVAAIGNGALARAETANRQHRYADAAAAATTARRWMPWSAEPLKALGEAQLEQGQIAAARASFAKAISIDPSDWQAWLDDAAAVTGSERRRAVAQAHRLYPTSPEVAEFEQSAGSSQGSG